MAKRSAQEVAGSESLSKGEAAVMRRLGDGEVPVGIVVKGLRGEGYGTDQSVQALLSLQRGKKVTVQEASPYSTLSSYVQSPYSLWLWTAAGAVVVSLVLIWATSGVALYLRYVFGGALVLFLPGYALIEALYPKRELDELTRFALSIGLSLALSPLTGLVLNYTPFGIRLIPVALSLATLTLILLVVALTRKHAYYRLAKGVL